MKANQRTVFKPAPLTVRGVFKDFQAIAKSSGRSAMDEKRARIQKLLVFQMCFPPTSPRALLQSEREPRAHWLLQFFWPGGE
mmetsp:Transcript_461/g.699  ORF Transcript_461/g.699 Transcript_461/m.699 type:complete len:82 (+) Transcript_461:598-843(+)